MSKYTRQRQVQESVQQSESMFVKVEREMADGYLETGIGGISPKQLAYAYRVMVRGAWASMVGGLRSLVRVNPAH